MQAVLYPAIRQPAPQIIFTGICINRLFHSHPTRYHSIHIAIDNGTRHIIGKGTNSRCCIIAYSFHFSDSRICIRECALPGNRTGSLMQVSGTGIIAQPLPIFHHLIFTSICQGLEIRKTFDKPAIIIVSLCNTRLLQDNFGYPYFIRIFRISPRQITFILFIPIYNLVAQQTHPKCFFNIYTSQIFSKNKAFSKAQATFYKICSKEIFLRTRKAIYLQSKKLR